MSASNENDPCFTVSELMERWKCSRKTVLDLISKGRLRAFRLGDRAFRVALAEVERHEKTSALDAAV